MIPYRRQARAALRTSTMVAAVTGLLAAAGPAGAAEECGDLLLVVDRSGSMNNCRIEGKDKEDIAKAGIKSVVAKFPWVPMGLMVFPDTLGESFTSCSQDDCKGGRVVVPIAAGGGATLSAWLDTMKKSCGGTPTGDTMQNVLAYDGWTPGKTHFVLLLTDGQPTCDEGSGCNGYGNKQCPNPSKAYDAIKALAAKGIHTFVVGFEGMGEGVGCNGGTAGKPFDPDTLNKFAVLGGEPDSGPTKYYSVTNEATLGAALEKIVGKAGGATAGGCFSRGDAGGGGGGSGSEPPRDAGGQADQPPGPSPTDPPGASPHGQPGCACAVPGSDTSVTPIGVLIVLGCASLVASARRRRSVLGHG